MNCWHCGNELIWGGDQDLDGESDDFDIVSNFSCASEECGAFVLVYLPIVDVAEDS
jgi:hypothetical protein